jgi:hypothetical protein
MERKVTWRTKGFKQYKNGSKGKNRGQAKKTSHRGHGCLCCVCCKDGSMEHKVTRRTKGFKQYKNGSKGKNRGQAKKKKFSHRPDRPWGPPSLLYNGYRVSFPGVKRPGHGVDHPPSSSARVKERVDLYLYSPSGPSWPVLGRTLLYLHIFEAYRFTRSRSSAFSKISSQIPFII